MRLSAILCVLLAATGMGCGPATAATADHSTGGSEPDAVECMYDGECEADGQCNAGQCVAPAPASVVPAPVPTPAPKPSTQRWAWIAPAPGTPS